MKKVLLVLSQSKRGVLLFLLLFVLNQNGFSQSCASPHAITINAAAISGTITSSMTGSVNSYYSNGCASPTDGTCNCLKYEHWYRFTPTVAGTHVITVVGGCSANGCSVNSGMNPVIELRTNACPGTLIEGINNTGRYATEILSTTNPLVAGTAYKIRVYAYHCNDAATWNYTIKVDGPTCVPPGATTVSGNGSTFCGQTTLLASGGSAGTIYFQGTTSGGTSTATPSAAQIVTSSGTYYFRSYDGTCWGTEGSATVTITPGPCLQWLNQNCTTAGTGSYIDGGLITPTPALQFQSTATTIGNWGFVFWTFNASADSTYYFDLCSSTGTTNSWLRLHNARNTSPSNNFCMDGSNTPTWVIENIANGCSGTGTGLSKLIWTCKVSGTYYLESAGENFTYWGVQASQTAILNYKTLPSFSYVCTDVFYDKGINGTDGVSSSYNNNEDWTYTYYPLDTIGSAINAQFVSFSTAPGDVLCVYDGNSVNANQIGCYAGPSITGAFSSTASDGSLTFEFKTDNTGVGAGWEANISCVPNIGIRNNGSASLKDKIRIFPNPVKGQLEISGLTVDSKTKIQILDMVGKSVYSQRAGSQPDTRNSEPKTTIDVSALPSGVYFIQIESGAGNWNGKFNKQ